MVELFRILPWNFLWCSISFSSQQRWLLKTSSSAGSSLERKFPFLLLSGWFDSFSSNNLKVFYLIGSKWIAPWGQQKSLFPFSLSDSLYKLAFLKLVVWQMWRDVFPGKTVIYAHTKAKNQSDGLNSPFCFIKSVYFLVSFPVLNKKFRKSSEPNTPWTQK